MLTRVTLLFGFGVAVGCATGARLDEDLTVPTEDSSDAGHQADARPGAMPAPEDGGQPDATTLPDATRLPDAESEADSSRQADANPDADAAAPDAASEVCTLVINELTTGISGNPTYEFVEVYNTCSRALDVGDWKLVYRGGSSTAAIDPSHDASLLWHWPAGATVPPHGFLVYGGSGFAGSHTGILANGLGDGNGAVAIRDATGHVIDSIGYGTEAAGNAFTERHAAAANHVVPSPGNSNARHPDGHDTDDNQADFTNVSLPTPGAAN